jgi:hypothetical protein
MVQSSISGPVSSVAQSGGVTLSCRPDRAGNKLIFPYQVENHGAADIYVMDATPMPDPTTGRQIVDPHAPVIWFGSDGFAHILKGIAPLPDDRDVDVRIIPVAAKLPPNATLERRLEVPLPLAETSPYYTDLPLREYTLTDIQGVTLIVEFMRSTVEGFNAEPAPNAPDLFRVAGRHTVGQTERVLCAYPSRQLQILKRSDAFPRPE